MFGDDFIFNFCSLCFLVNFVEGNGLYVNVNSICYLWFFEEIVIFWLYSEGSFVGYKVNDELWDLFGILRMNDSERCFVVV